MTSLYANNLFVSDLDNFYPNSYCWTRLSNGSWRDESSKIIWLPIEPGKYNHYDAMKLEDEHKRLPTKKEFKEAEKHGIRQIMDMKNRWFWSSSLYPNDSDFAYVLDGTYGSVFNDNRSYNYGSVVCLGRKIT